MADPEFKLILLLRITLYFLFGYKCSKAMKGCFKLIFPRYVLVSFCFAPTQEAPADFLPYWTVIRISVSIDDAWGSYYLPGTELSL